MVTFQGIRLTGNGRNVLGNLHSMPSEIIGPIQKLVQVTTTCIKEKFESLLCDTGEFK